MIISRARPECNDSPLALDSRKGARQTIPVTTTASVAKQTCERNKAKNICAEQRNSMPLGRILRCMHFKWHAAYHPKKKIA
eukprot:2369108-Amphidinium_carterae.1